MDLAGLTGKLGAFLALLGGTYAIKSLITDTIKTNTQLHFMALNLGMGVQSLSAWGTVAKEFGGTAQGLQGTLHGLSLEMTKFALTPGQSDLAPFLSWLGVKFNALHPDAAKLMTDIGAKMRAKMVEGMSRPTAANILEMKGFDEGAINALLGDPKQLQSALAEAGKLAPTDKEASDAANLNKQLVLMDAHLQKIATELTEQSTPALSHFFTLIDRISNWIISHPEITEWVAGIGLGVAGLSASLTALKMILPGIAAGFDLLTGPLGLIAGSIVAIGAVVDTMVSNSEAQEKLIGPPGSDVTAVRRQQLERAAFTTEGYFAKTGDHPNISQRANNPANIMYGPFAKEHGAIGSITATDPKTGEKVEIAKFRDAQAGKDAYDAFMQLHAGMTVRDFANLLIGPNKPPAEQAEHLRHFLAASGGLTAGQILPSGVSSGEKPANLWSGLGGGSPISVLPAIPNMAPPNIPFPWRSITNHIGEISIFTQATDAKKMAFDLGKGTDWLTFATQANGGQQ